MATKPYRVDPDGFSFGDAQVGALYRQLLQSINRFQFCEWCPDARMDSGPKGNVPLWITHNIETIGIREHAWITIG